MKVRVDKLLVERGLAPSRERAQALILAGKVLANEQKIDKSGTTIDPHAAIRLLGEDLKYVSRGGLKLEHALEHWRIDVNGKTCLDVGASTGGFTDCLLRQDRRVRLLEKTNARYLTAAQVGEFADVIAMDVSFISATLVLPAVIAAAFPQRDSRGGRQLIVLVKPQFEAGREYVGKGGIVRDQAAHRAAIERVRKAVLAEGCQSVDVIDSPIQGVEGNKEFLLQAVF